MQLAAIIIFSVSLVLILALFVVKYFEARREERFLESVRVRADEGALRVKSALQTAEDRLANAPFFLSALARWGVHVGALSFARLAHLSAVYAHRLADVVSHKHRFERGETKSRYLKEVSEYRNGNGNGGEGQV